SLTESETGHRCRGVGTDPGQGQQGRVVLRNLATVLFGDGHGTGVQTQRAAWITESAPHAYGLARGLRGQVGGGGPPFRPLLPHRKDPGDRGLLEHYLTDEDRPRAGVGGAPGKLASMGIVPCEDS